MTLSEFILANMENILHEWEEHARTIPAAGKMDPVALRDHAELILKRIAKDIARAQSEEQQKEKSRGKAPKTSHETAAEQHARSREGEGFNLNEMASEYRALRASVIQL